MPVQIRVHTLPGGAGLAHHQLVGHTAFPSFPVACGALLGEEVSALFRGPFALRKALAARADNHSQVADVLFGGGATDIGTLRESHSRGYQRESPDSH